MLLYEKILNEIKHSTKILCDMVTDNNRNFIIIRTKANLKYKF